MIFLRLWFGKVKKVYTLINRRVSDGSLAWAYGFGHT